VREPIIQRAPVKIAMRPSTHHQPSVSPRKPPTIGPSVGPINGAVAKTDMARPHCDAGNMSAMTRLASVRGEEPKAPAKNRRMMRDWVFWVSTAPALKAVRTPISPKEEDLLSIEF